MAPNEAAIEKALVELGNGTCTNVLQASKKWKVSQSTLNRRFRKGQLSNSEFHCDFQCRLTRVQEEKVIEWITELSRRNLPPTPEMIRGFVERLLDEEIGKNWVTRFLKRHSTRLIGKYLPGLDASRVRADANRKCYQVWFQNVRLLYFFMEI